MVGQESPQRHRDHREDFQVISQHGADFFLRALCVSVVNISRNKANFPPGVRTVSVAQEIGYARMDRLAGFENKAKQSQFAGGLFLDSLPLSAGFYRMEVGCPMRHKSRPVAQL